MKLIKFNTAGRWADPSNTLTPQIDVKKGDEIEVSDALADLVVSNGRGEVIVVELSEEEQEAEKLRLAKEAEASEDVATQLESAKEGIEFLTAARDTLIKEKSALIEERTALLADKEAAITENNRLIEVGKSDAETIEGLQVELCEARTELESTKPAEKEAEPEKKTAGKKTPAAKDKSNAES